MSEGAAEALVGREEELLILTRVLAAACDGAGAAALVEGEAGIGKTSLLAAARADARRRGMTVLRARGTDLEREFPFAIARQALAPLLRDQGSATDLLRGAARLAAPVLLDAPDDAGAAPGGLLHGLYWLVANAAQGTPVLLEVDDAHWADEASLRFLAYLVRRVESMPVALLVAARPTGRSVGAVATVLGELGEDPATLRLELRGLSPADIGHLLGRAGAERPDGELAASCHAATGGNPFLVGELARVLSREDGALGAQASPLSEITLPGVARSTALTLARAGADATALARAAVLLGEGESLERAAALGLLPARSVGHVVALLVDAGILADEETIRFRHPILIGAVRAGMSRHERAEGHGRAADLLRSRGEPPERIALHLLHATRRGDAAVVVELRAAAEHARRRGAPQTACALLERALEEPPADDDRADLLVALGEAELAAGDAGAAAEHFDAAYRCAADVRTRARALPLLVQARPGDPQFRREVAERAGETLREAAGLEPDLVLPLRAIRIMEGERFDEPLPAGATLAEAIFLGHLVFARMTADARADEIADIATRASRRADELALNGTSAIAFSGVVLGLRWSDRLDQAERLLERAIETARRHGSVTDFAMALTLRASVHRRAGRLRDAEADARGALAAALVPAWSFSRGIAPLVWTLLDQDRVGDAAEVVSSAALEAEIPDSPPMLAVLLARMALRAAQRDFGAALADWQLAAERVGRTRAVNAGWIDDLAVLTDVHLGRGDREAARASAQQMLRLARCWGTPGAMGQALHACARVDASIDMLSEATSQLRESPARLELARALVSLGSALRRAGMRSDSRSPLREAYEIALACDASGVGEVARTELRASGVRLRREPVSGAAALTPSEGRIAALAADGRSNAEIAQELFVTSKTVEMHLTSTYRKLGIHGRAELGPAVRAKT